MDHTASCLWSHTPVWAHFNMEHLLHQAGGQPQQNQKSIPARGAHQQQSSCMAPHKLNNRYPESIATTDESSKFRNCSVLEQATWLKQLPKTLAADDVNFRTLWEECSTRPPRTRTSPTPNHRNTRTTCPSITSTVLLNGR